MEKAHNNDRTVERRESAAERGGRFVCETDRDEHNSCAHPSTGGKVIERLDAPSTQRHQSLLLS